jgi:hypothetical protein
LRWLRLLWPLLRLLLRLWRAARRRQLAWPRQLALRQTRRGGGR